MQVDIKTIRYNPYRDLVVYPIDREHVELLKRSLTKNDQFSSLPARPNGEGFEIAAGHHRLEAMRELGYKTVEISITDHDDDAMISIMASENATQKAHRAAACNDSVAAAFRRMAAVALMPDTKMDSEGKNLPSDSKNVFKTAQARSNFRAAIKGSKGGLGTEKAITEYLTDDEASYSRGEVTAALGTLANDGTTARILAEVDKAAREAADLLEAQRLKAEAEAKAEIEKVEKEAAAEPNKEKAKRKVAKAKKEAAKKVTAIENEQTEAEKHLSELEANLDKAEPTLAPGLGALFEKVDHQKTFQDMVTREHKGWFSIDEQPALAEELKKDHKELTSAKIKEWFKNRVRAMEKARAKTPEEVEAIEQLTDQEFIQKQFDTIMKALNMMDDATIAVNEHIKEKGWPAGVRDFGAMRHRLDWFLREMQALRDSLS